MIGGESFAGTYIPYFADAMLSEKIPLAGIVIGNGYHRASFIPSYQAGWTQSGNTGRIQSLQKQGISWTRPTTYAFSSYH